MARATRARASSTGRREVLVRRIRFLVAFSITYNLLEAVAALAAGAVADSSALIGFGLDSSIEVASAFVVAWQFAGPAHEERERVALRVIAYAFFALAAFVSFNAITALASGDAPAHSPFGIVIAALSLAVMPVVSLLQRRAGTELGSASAVADSKQTLLCTWMSAALLIGLLANSVVGWWWADPVAALVIASLAVREGVNAYRGVSCCSPAQALLTDLDPADLDSTDAPRSEACARHEAMPAQGRDGAGCHCGAVCPACGGRPGWSTYTRRTLASPPPPPPPPRRET